MTKPVLLSEDVGGIRVLTLNRPKALNALNAPLIAQLQEALQAAESDLKVRVIILQGAGDRAFVAGADITELKEMSPL
ncbi:MAG: enoyl-CoA hydratase/isomerase family protein, partial [Planctomycetota bacterium]|nr:enoyl-CoA hydratase/isomerase family protein [Planctomycetota bacterium]